MSAFDPAAAARPDAGLFGLASSPDEARVHVFGVPWDATCSYRKGARHGPRAIACASHQVDLFDLEFGRPYEAGIAFGPIDERIADWNAEASELADPILAAGGLDAALELGAQRDRVDELGARRNAAVGEAVERALRADRIPIVVGGDHSSPFGAIEAATQHHAELGVLHVDAHADLRTRYEGFRWSHASILHNVVDRLPLVTSVLQLGIRDLCEEEFDRIEQSDGRVVMVPDPVWANAKLDGNLRELVRRELQFLPRDVWITLDVDGLDPSLCPNTGTPVPGGLDWHDAMLVLTELARSERRIVGADLCEVSPGDDWNEARGDRWDAIVGARLLYRLIGAALATR